MLQTQFIFSDDSEKIELLYKNIAALEEEIVVLRNLVEENSYLIERLQELNQQRYLETDKRIYDLSLLKNNKDFDPEDIENILEDEQMEFYGRYKSRASRLRHRGSPESLIALKEKLEAKEDK